MLPNAKASPTTGDHTREILEQGFSVFPKLFDDDEVDQIRSAILDRVAEVNPVSYWAPENRSIGHNIEVTPTGVALPRLLSDRPELAPLVLKPEVVESIQGALGDDMRLELVGAVVTDQARPFFAWHVHIGGVPDAVYRHEGWPEIDGVDRVLTLCYLDDIGPESGQLLVYPRAAGDPTPPPQDPYEEQWEGEIEVTVPRGTVVALEQCTWHAARPMKRDGYRVFMACYFRAARLEDPEWVDHDLHTVADANPLIASLIGPKPESP